ncbi:MAG: CYTH domain-containing protein [Candidatus Daviesbacteria bacterium]|nr:CYTH domain-containing protein [Candidatus Daviesbacteria bacterium]
MKKDSQTEFETKVLDLDKEEVIKKLRELGAKESPEALSRRYVFDMESEDMEWIRLREIDGKATLAYKFKPKGNIQVGKTQEIETEVANFEETAKILLKIPFKQVLYQENKTHIFHLNGIEYSIDTWPMLEPYLEIESSSLEKVAEGLKLLNLEGKDIGDKDIRSIYLEKNIDFHTLTDLKFEKN